MLTELGTSGWIGGPVGVLASISLAPATQERGYWFHQTSSSFLFLHFLTTFSVAEHNMAWQKFPVLLWQRLCSTADPCPSVPTQVPPTKFGPPLGPSFVKTVVCTTSPPRRVMSVISGVRSSLSLHFWGMGSSQTAKPQNKSASAHLLLPSTDVCGRLSIQTAFHTGPQLAQTLNLGLYSLKIRYKCLKKPKGISWPMVFLVETCSVSVLGSSLKE